MLYTDSIYGDINIQEPVILDLINSPELQRLKDVDMAGYFEPHFPGSAHSRFEHSLGVYLLLKRYSASIEEQIAGLIHDVSHGAFSHCLDYVFDEGSQKEQTHQDNIFEKFVKESGIPRILETYGIDINYVVDDKNFPLKERLLPDLCADRIDYILRGSIHYEKRDGQEMQDMLHHLVVHDTDRVFDDIAYAKKYAELFQRINDRYFSGFLTAVMFQTTGDFLKHALKENYITRKDLYTTDKQVINKILPYLETDEKLLMYRQRMNNKIPFKNDPNDFDVQVFCKNRMVDPLFFTGKEIKRLSDAFPERKKIIQNVRPKEYFLKFEK